MPPLPRRARHCPDDERKRSIVHWQELLRQDGCAADTAFVSSGSWDACVRREMACRVSIDAKAGSNDIRAPHDFVRTNGLLAFHKDKSADTAPHRCSPDSRGGTNRSGTRCVFIASRKRSDEPDTHVVPHTTRSHNAQQTCVPANWKSRSTV